MKKLLLVALGLFLVRISSASLKCAGDEDSLELIGRLNLRPFTYKMTYDPETDRGQFRLLRRGRAVYRQKGSHFYINPASECGGLPIAGTSITGRHRHQLAVVDWNGGAHCCYTLHIIALDAHPSLIQKIELGHSTPDFQDLDKDGVFELILSDWTFAYWKVAFAQSPASKVILSFNGKKWVFDPEWNSKAPPPRGDFLKHRSDIERAFTDTKSDAGSGDYGDTGAPFLLWEQMLELIYTGNADLASELIDASWPSDNPYKKRFLCEFRLQLRQSPFWDGLKKINRADAFFLRNVDSCQKNGGGHGT